MMDYIDILSAILTLLAGIGIFLVACSLMSSNLESLSSNSLKTLFSKAGKSKMLGVGIGAVGTALIQSSGAVAVMVIGFVNAGIMNLSQAASIIFGASIGTTITGQIVALGMASRKALSTTVIFSSLVGIGSFINIFAKKDKVKQIGNVITGFGMLFVGLSMMSGSMEKFAALQVVKDFLSSINNAILLTIIGAILTAIVQSSSVMTSIAITMVVSGLISLDQGIFIAMGSNIGTCVVGMIAGFTSKANAKRTALLQLIFKTSGVVVFLVVHYIMALSGVTFGDIFIKLFPDAPQTQLAMFHTFFNVVATVMWLPFTDVLVRLVERMIKDDDKEDELHLYFVNDYMLKTPVIAVQQVKNEILNMAELAITNYRLSLDCICENDYSKMDVFKHNEKELDYINSELVKFIVKLSSLPLNEKDHKYLSLSYHTITDLERIGDYAENITEYAETLKESNEKFSLEAIDEIYVLRVLIDDLYEKIVKCYKDEDLKALIEAEKIEDKVDIATDKMNENHVIRLNKGICTPSVGAQYLSLASNSERVADHLINVGESVGQLLED